MDGDNIMNGNLGRIGKYVSIDELKYKGGSMDAMDMHVLHNRLRLRRDTDGGSYSDHGFLNTFDLTTSFKAFQGHKVNSQSYMGGDGDYDGPYDVAELFYDIPSGTSKHIYIGHRSTIYTGNRWCNDVAMAAVQVLNMQGEVVDFIPMTNSTFYYASNEVTTKPTPQQVAAYTYLTIGTSQINNRFCYRTGTSSPRTGALDSIDTSSTVYGAGLKPMPLTQYSFSGSSTFPSIGALDRPNRRWFCEPRPGLVQGRVLPREVDCWCLRAEAPRCHRWR